MMPQTTDDRRRTARLLIEIGLLALAALALLLLSGCQPPPSHLEPVTFEAAPPAPTMSDVDFKLMKLDLRFKGMADSLSQQITGLQKTVDLWQQRANDDRKAMDKAIAAQRESLETAHAELSAKAAAELKQINARLDKLEQQKPIVLDASKAVDKLADAVKSIPSMFPNEPPPGLLIHEPKPKPIEPKPVQPKPNLPQSDRTDFLPTETYSQAFALSNYDGRPLLAFIGAKWCAPCKRAHQWLPMLRQRGHLAYVDLDADASDAANIYGSKTIPALVVYRKVNGRLLKQATYTDEGQIGLFASGALGDTPSNDSPPPPPIPNSSRALPDTFRYPGGDVLRSRRDATLTAFAQRHSEEQARRSRQGHDVGTPFSVRFRQLCDTLGNAMYREICAESWPEQSGDSAADLWREMFHCWQQSPGHWSVASVTHEAFGAGIAQSARNGVWYATIITKN